MKKLYHRSISGLMALLICFTTILGGGITAFAASSSGEVAKSYSIGFPRSGDANLDYSGTWGHDELHYMNGWTSGEATWMTTLHTIGSFDGPACYCIEPGVPRLLEKAYTRYISSWREADREQWNRARWFNGMDAAQTADENKTIVCGHWHTSYGHSKYEHKGTEFGEDADFSPYYGPGIIAIDACTAFSGKVNCLVIED